MERVLIKNLEEKQDKHNSIIERTYKLESDVKVLQALQNTEGRYENIK